MAITDWPASERPREKLLSIGTEALTDAELLAIFLRTGTQGKSAVALAQELLTEHQGLRPLLAASRERFCSHHGLGNAKYCQLQAAMEMARRHLKEQLVRNDTFLNPEQTRAFVHSQMSHHKREIFACLFLDNHNRLIKYQELFQGTISNAPVYPREVVRAALDNNAAAVIFAHNHPSGIAEPSQCDLEITQSLRKALQLVEVRVLDHLVVGSGSIVSLAERGQI